MREHLGGHVLLVRIERRERAFEMLADDRLGAAQAVQRPAPEYTSLSGTLCVPDPLEHELQIRRFDPRTARLVEDSLDELGLDGDVLFRQAVPAVDRSEDRAARR